MLVQVKRDRCAVALPFDYVSKGPGLTSDTFRREHRIVLPAEINPWVALTALLDRLDKTMKEIGGRQMGRKQSTIWATDGSHLSRKSVQEAVAAVRENGLTAQWCHSTSAVGPLFANRGRYEVYTSTDDDGTHRLRVEVSSSQKTLANALSATITEFDADLSTDAEGVSSDEMNRLDQIRSRRRTIKSWFSTHAVSLGVNTLSAVIGGLIVGLVLVFGFGIR